MIEALDHLLREHPVGLLFVILAFGYLIGKTKIRGFELGTLAIKGEDEDFRRGDEEVLRHLPEHVHFAGSERLDASLQKRRDDEGRGGDSRRRGPATGARATSGR